MQTTDNSVRNISQAGNYIDTVEKGLYFPDLKSGIIMILNLGGLYGKVCMFSMRLCS